MRSSAACHQSAAPSSSKEQDEANIILHLAKENEIRLKRIERKVADMDRECKSLKVSVHYSKDRLHSILRRTGRFENASSAVSDHEELSSSSHANVTRHDNSSSSSSSSSDLDDSMPKNCMPTTNEIMRSRGLDPRFNEEEELVAEDNDEAAILIDTAGGPAKEDDSLQTGTGCIPRNCSAECSMPNHPCPVVLIEADDEEEVPVSCGETHTMQPHSAPPHRFHVSGGGSSRNSGGKDQRDATRKLLISTRSSRQHDSCPPPPPQQQSKSASARARRKKKRRRRSLHHYDYPTRKKWRRMIRTKRLQSILLTN
mmetsp:Transcript_3917/g.11062  ORF Transcript_3917/g.11062 Transcript_3917/m.11062 type:complete len:313 (-) Transcript_3917:87-1025(-)